MLRYERRSRANELSHCLTSWPSLDSPSPFSSSFPSLYLVSNDLRKQCIYKYFISWLLELSVINVPARSPIHTQRLFPRFLFAFIVAIIMKMRSAYLRRKNFNEVGEQGGEGRRGRGQRIFRSWTLRAVLANITGRTWHGGQECLPTGSRSPQWDVVSDWGSSAFFAPRPRECGHQLTLSNLPPERHLSPFRFFLPPPSTKTHLSRHSVFDRGLSSAGDKKGCQNCENWFVRLTDHWKIQFCKMLLVHGIKIFEHCCL